MKRSSGLSSIDYNSVTESWNIERLDFVIGDTIGLNIPTHADALEAAGAVFLTQAFQVFGALDAENSVTRIVRIESCQGGSTGSKLFLSVEYAHPDPRLHNELFVKFSRDFDDARRDRGRYEMQAEIPFTAISRSPEFPIRVPAGYFADFHAESGTGLVITERVPFGEDNVEHHRRKALDYLTMPEPLAYYRPLVASLARIAAAHKAGKLPADVETLLPFDPSTGSADPIRYDHDGLEQALDRCDDFARRCPQLLPDEVRSSEFRATMRRDAHRIREQEAKLQAFLQGDPRMIALCHWNAHVDNAFFWRDQVKEIHCGLIDWGRVGQITFGSALWGALSAAEDTIWDEHFDTLLNVFVEEYRRSGGPSLTAEELKLHVLLHVATMGVSRVLVLPEYVTYRLPECVAAHGPRDPMFLAADQARNCLRMYTNFLRLWQRFDFGKLLEDK